MLKSINLQILKRPFAVNFTFLKRLKALVAFMISISSRLFIFCYTFKAHTLLAMASAGVALIMHVYLRKRLSKSQNKLWWNHVESGLNEKIIVNILNR